MDSYEIKCGSLSPAEIHAQLIFYTYVVSPNGDISVPGQSDLNPYPEPTFEEYIRTVQKMLDNASVRLGEALDFAPSTPTRTLRVRQGFAHIDDALQLERKTRMAGGYNEQESAVRPVSDVSGEVRRPYRRVGPDVLPDGNSGCTF